MALLGPEDGKEDIAKTARKLAEEVARGERQVDEVTQEALGESLDTWKGLPDPCLVVTLGPASSTAQFPPWQLRLSEIHRLPSHKGLLPDDLESVLTRFNGSPLFSQFTPCLFSAMPTVSSDLADRLVLWHLTNRLKLFQEHTPYYQCQGLYFIYTHAQCPAHLQQSFNMSFPHCQ